MKLRDAIKRNIETIQDYWLAGLTILFLFFSVYYYAKYAHYKVESDEFRRILRSEIETNSVFHQRVEGWVRDLGERNPDLRVPPF